MSAIARIEGRRTAGTGVSSVTKRVRNPPVCLPSPREFETLENDHKNAETLENDHETCRSRELQIGQTGQPEFNSSRSCLDRFAADPSETRKFSDEFDRSISEAIKVTKKKQPSPEPVLRRFPVRPDYPAANGRQNGNLEYSGATSSSLRNGSGETDAEHTAEPSRLTRSDRWRRRPQRYSEKEFVEAVSDNEADFDSDEEIVGEAIYDDEYIKRRRRKKSSSSSEGDEEYRGDDENIEEEDDDYGNALSTSEEMDDSRNGKWGHGKNIGWASGRKRKGLKLKSVGELQSGLRRSKRATHNIDYRLYDMSSSEEEYAEDVEKLAGSSNEIDMPKSQSDVSDSADYYMESEDCLDDITEKRNDGEQFMKSVNAVDGPLGKASFEERTKVTREQPADVKKRRFIDLNELAPFSGHDDGPAA